MNKAYDPAELAGADPTRTTGDETQGHAAPDHMGHGHVTGRGYLNGPGLVNHPVEYVVVENDVCLHEGCIDMGYRADVEAETARIDAALHAARATGRTLEAAGDTQEGVGLPSTSSRLWTDGIVHYAINSDVPDQGRVEDAIRHIEENSAIRFRRRILQPNYVEIISNGNLGWSSSSVGMVGGRQLLRLSDRHGWQILVHEFLHALGVYHEQSRSDRDQFVEIKWDNIDDDAIGNFQKKPGTVDYNEYDYGSIMHYPGTSFAKDRSKPTIVPKQRGVTIGQRQALSYGDRQTLATMYERFFPKGYAGVWRAGSGRYGLWVNASWSSFVSKWREWSAQGLRLHDIHLRTVNGAPRYSGVFLPGSGRYGLWANVPYASFREKWVEWSRSGLRLADLHVHRTAGGETRYSGVFLPGSGGYGLWVNSSWNAFHDRWQTWSGQGLRLVDLNVLRHGGRTRYYGVFAAGSGGHALWANASWSSFRAKWSELSGQGLRLVDLDIHQSGSATRYSGCFLPGTDAHYLWANVTWESFRAKWEELAAQGLRLIDFEMAIPPGGVADMADQSLAGQAADGFGDAPFGGIFEDEAALQPEAGEGPLDPAQHGGLGGTDATDGPSVGDGAGEGEAVFGEAVFGEAERQPQGPAGTELPGGGVHANANGKADAMGLGAVVPEPVH